MVKLVIASLLLLSAALTYAREPESLDQLKQRAEAAKPEHQPKLFIEAAHRQALAAAEAYENGKSEEGKKAVTDVALLGEKAGAAAVASRKNLKETEIKLRGLADKLEGLLPSLDMDDREPVQAAIQRLQKVRDSLTQAMFGPKS
jgi:hypothetical protein